MKQETHWSFVWRKHLAIGGLLCYPDKGYRQFGYVLNVAREASVRQSGDGMEAPCRDRDGVYHLPIDDVDSDTLVMPDATARLVEVATKAVIEQLHQSKTVLLTCVEGRNRSALVAALAMVRMGMDPWAALELVRNGREPYFIRPDSPVRRHVLTNRTFEKWLLRQRNP